LAVRHPVCATEPPFSYAGRKNWSRVDAKLGMTPRPDAVALQSVPAAATVLRPLPDVARGSLAARELLLALGADLESESLRDTPRRMVAALAELLTPEPFEATTFPNDGGYDEMVVARSIPFHSLCEHHVLPFHGVAHIGYVPGERIIGLSKLGRVVELFARRLQVQERMTVEIADWLTEQMAPAGVGVVLEAEHLCMSLRGVHKPGTRTVTSALQGLIRDDPRSRQEFLALAAS
jgi:GTP cyclohydrolase I